MDFTLEPQAQFSKKSIISISIAVLAHILAGYALVSGLARDVVTAISNSVETRIIEEVKPAPSLPPPPPKKIQTPRVVKPAPTYVPPPEVQASIPSPQNVIANISHAPADPVPVPVSSPTVTAHPTVAKVGLACPNSTAIRQSLVYPRQALQNNISGSVIVQFVVDATGHSRDFNLFKSAHPLLNRAALEAAQRFSCVGQGQDVTVQVPFEFKVE